MPDTTIFRDNNGWFDRDAPADIFGTRREARNSRRNRLFGIKAYDNRVTNVQLTGGDNLNWTSLQHKLYNRLTTQQGVPHDDAVYVISNNGYNKAASYGHMREAGANHSEAMIVIDMSDPVLSVSYGQHRAAGWDHSTAFTMAIDERAGWSVTYAD